MKRKIGEKGILRVSIILCLISSLCLAHEGHTRRLAELERKGRSHYRQAADLRFNGKYEKADLLFRSALELAHKTDNRLEVGKCLRELGYVAWDLGDVRKASDWLTEALSIGHGIRDPDIVRSCMDSLKIIEFYLLGRQARDANDNKRSIEYFSQASTLSQEAGLPSFYLKCLRQKASTYWHMGSLEAYFECSKQGLEISRQINHRKEEGRYLNNLGVFYTSLNDHYKALEFFEEARDIAADQKDRSTVAECINNMATIYMNLGNYYRAEHLYLDAYALDKARDDAEAIIMDLNNLGNINLKIAQMIGKTENLQVSLAYLNESLSMLQLRDQPSTKIQVMNNIGALYYLQEKYDLAKRLFVEGLDEARSIGYSEAENTFLLNMGLVAFHNKEITNAISFLETAVRSASETKNLDVLWEAYYGLGLCYEQFQDRGAALKAYKKSIDTIERTRRSIPSDIHKIGFTQNRVMPYQKTIDILYVTYSADPSRTVLDDIFNIIERGKAQAFLEGIDKDVADIIAAGPRICSISDIQNGLLDDRSVMLEYFLGKSGSYLVAITKRASHIYRIPDQGKIEKSLRAYLKYISSPPGSLPRTNAASTRIGRELLFPLETLRDKEIDTIVIIPDGLLHHLPFETLSLGDDQATDFLIERYKIHYGASASSLYVLKKRKSDEGHKKALLAFGGLNYDHNQENKQDRGSLSPLPFSKMEAQEIAKMFPNPLCDVYLEDEAIEEYIKNMPLNGYQIIHFAGHGFSDGNHPFRSALILSASPQRREDGYLRMSEIGQLKMNADLIVLSACQTGIGVLEKSEGFLSLSRIFFYAGARSVLASLWFVSDSTTTDLMKHFYTHFLQGNDTSQALRLAKLELLRSDHSHPFYWAGFVLNGHPAVAMEMR